MEFIMEVCKDAAADNIKLLPFLFITYLLMEYLENKMEEKSHDIMKRSGHVGPVFGGILGIFPQCGFSTAASNLYAGGIITVGTLLSVYLSTSDEMLPIFISEAVPAATIAKILLAKMALGMITGFIIDLIFHVVPFFHVRHKDIHHLCEQEHCHCEDGIWLSAIKHTLKIFAFIFVISFVIGLLIEGIGEEHLAALIMNRPVLGEVIAGVIGLIPNCAASVIITELYLGGVIGAGAMMTGLLVGAGVGVLVLVRMNRSIKENVSIIIALYLTSVIWGILIETAGITF